MNGKPFCIGTVWVDPPLLLAPMAGYTNYAFRCLVRRLGGAGLLCTEMVSAEGLLHRRRFGKGWPEQLWGLQEEAQPLAVQIWDDEPGRLAEAAAWLVEEFHISIVDINFGCPARQVAQKAQSGAYLLAFPERIGTIIERVAAACRPTPVTAKIRLGPHRQQITAHEVAQAVEQAGGAALIVHGRTAQERFGGRADWEAIARLKSYLKRIPLIGNGDLRRPADVAAAFRQWPVDGVMIGRAALGQPWLFQQAAALLQGQPPPPEPTLAQRRHWLLEYYDRMCQQHGPKKATLLMRRYAPLFVQGLPYARQFRTQLCQTNSPEEFLRLVQEFFDAFSSTIPPHARSRLNQATSASEKIDLNR